MAKKTKEKQFAATRQWKEGDSVYVGEAWLNKEGNIGKIIGRDEESEGLVLVSGSAVEANGSIKQWTYKYDTADFKDKFWNEEHQCWDMNNAVPL